MRIILVAAAAVCWLGAAMAASNEDSPDAVALRASAVRDRFDAAIRACGVTPPYIANVVVKTTPGLVFYDSTDHSVYVPRWSKLDPAMQAMMKQWAAQGTLGLDAEGQFGEIFNELLVAHELGHYLQFVSGRYTRLDHWQAELEASEIALAFWSLTADGAARVPQRVENFSRFLLSVPAPVPAGGDAQAYFISHYDALGENPAAYGWFQGRFMTMAASSKRDFCAWVQLNRPQAPRG